MPSNVLCRWRLKSWQTAIFVTTCGALCIRKRTVVTIADAKNATTILKRGLTKEEHEASKERCRKCLYRNYGESCCDYLAITGKPRILVSPGVGEDCTEFRPMNGTVVRKTASMTIRPNAGERPREQLLRRSQQLYRQMKTMYEEGMSDRAIAAELRCSASAVKRWRVREGLHVNNRGSIPNKEIARRLELTRGLWAAGRTDAEIARAVGVSKRTVGKWRKDMGLAAHQKERELEYADE